jgi:hypothetical protein
MHGQPNTKHGQQPVSSTQSCRQSARLASPYQPAIKDVLALHTSMLMSVFSFFIQIFGSPSTPILENPEYQTRWYFKYFLGKREYLYALYQNMVAERMSLVPTVLDEGKPLGTQKNLIRRHNFVRNYKPLQVERRRYIHPSLSCCRLNCIQCANSKFMSKIFTIVIMRIFYLLVMC